jgi:hypothetical protein
VFRPNEEEGEVTHSLTKKLGVCALAAVMTVATTTAGFATERPAPTPPRPTLLISAQKHVQQIAKAPKPLASRSAQEGASGYDDPGSFFRTKRGVALLVLAAAGIGYMTYSAFHDRIHSDARERLDN